MAAGVELNAKYTLIGGPRDASRQNLIKNPTPFFDLTGWGSTNGSFSRVAGGAYGPRAFRLQNAASVFTDLNNNVASYRFPVVAGQTYSGAAWFKATTTARPVQCFLVFLNDALSQTGVLTGTLVGANNTSSWTQATVSGVAAVGSTQGYIIARIHNAAVGEAHYVDALQVNKGALAPFYFDGDMPGFYWKGDRFDSESAQDGTRVVLNDEADIDNIGVVTSITGLDSPEVVESVDENIGADGATHGTFYSGRRPIVLEGLIYKHGTIAVRNAYQQKLIAATNCLRRDGTLTWQPQGFPAMYAKVRKQQRTAISGNWNKEFQAALVAGDPRIFGNTKTVTEITVTGSGTAGRSYNRDYDLNYAWAPSRGSATITNSGDGNAAPLITLRGIVTNPAFQNTTTEKELALNITMTGTDELIIDFKTRKITLNGQPMIYSPIDLTRSWWWDLEPGENVIQLLASSFSGSPYFSVEWENAWL